MSDRAIRIQNLSKLYYIGHVQPTFPTLRDALVDRTRAALSRLQGRMVTKERKNTIWALKDVSFDVKWGEVMGIIGRNGAGKSTLLKILARITEPTRGCVELYGRVGSLLEVGTGFHPELSGRENIYLNGAILGMRRAEVRRRFDEIVAFAEVEKFLDTPVKYYSSGMYVRLAFAVAAHLEPEILILDEILAVGDAAFQKKCLGKMHDVATSGRTVLLVSHNMNAIQGLALRSCVLEKGEIVDIGPTAAVVPRYLERISQEYGGGLGATRILSQPDAGHIEDCWISSEGERSNVLKTGDDVVFHVKGELSSGKRDGYVSIEVYTSLGSPVYQFISLDGGVQLGNVQGSFLMSARVRRLSLYPGIYYAKIGLCDGAGYLLDFVDPACSFQVVRGDYPDVPRELNPKGGVVYEEAQWRLETLS